MSAQTHGRTRQHTPERQQKILIRGWEDFVDQSDPQDFFPGSIGPIIFDDFLTAAAVMAVTRFLIGYLSWIGVRIGAILHTDMMTR